MWMLRCKVIGPSSVYLPWIEVLSGITARHHHRGAKSTERYRGSDSRIYGRWTMPVRPQWRLKHSPRRGQKTGRAARQTGGECTDSFWDERFSSHWAFMKCFTINSKSFHCVQVYVASGTVYGLEAELGDLEECARCISGSTSERELAHLEDQVASAAAQVQQSELQVRSAWTLCSLSLSLSESQQQHLIALKIQLHFNYWAI